MSDQIEIGDLKDSHKIWRYVAIGAIALAVVFIGLAFASPSPMACIAIAAVCLILAGGMLLLMRFMDHTLLLTSEGICWLSQARRKVMPWSQVGGAKVDKIFPTDMHPMLLIDDIDGNRICGYGSGLLRFKMQEVADLINKMKQAHTGPEPASQGMSHTLADSPH